MNTLLLISFIFQIANGSIISSAFAGDWVRDAVNPTGKSLGRLAWQINVTENLLTIVESYQAESGKVILQTTAYKLDGTHIVDYSEPIPDWMSLDPLREHWLRIKNANEVELTTVSVRGYEIVQTLTLSANTLKVVQRFGAKDEVVYSFCRVTKK